MFDVKKTTRSDDWQLLFLPASHPVQFSSVAQSCLTLCDPMDCSTPGFPVHHQLLELAQTHVHRVGDVVQPSLVPFSSCLQFFPASGSFSMSQFFISDAQSTGVSASAPVLPINIQFSSVQFSRSVVSDSLRPHESQHAKPPCPSPTPGVHVHRVSDAIQPSHPLSFPSPPAPNPSQHQSLFQ